MNNKKHNKLFIKFLRKKKIFEDRKKRGDMFKDSDDDGLTDYEERHIYHTNPHKRDTDGDGASDGLEVKYGRNPLGKGSIINLFIPSEENGFCPDILKPTRLIFYAISLILVKLIMVAFIVYYPFTAWMSVDVSMEESSKIISLTNNLRSNAGLSVLKENSKLDLAAQNKVQDMFAAQYFAHTSPSGVSLTSWIENSNYKYSIAGENLAIGYTDANELFDAWKNSPTHYENLIDPNFQEIGVAVSGGIFNDVDTVLAAQYFARPEKVAITKVSTTTKTISGDITIKGDNLADAKVLKTDVVLPSNVVSAVATISNEEIELNKSGYGNQWVGTKLISKDKEENILKPLVSATLITEDINGNITQNELEWRNVTPIKSSVIDRYSLYKNNPKSDMIPILFFGNFYFKILLGIFSAALIFYSFIKIKNKKLSPILNGVGIIVLIGILILI